MGLQAGVFTNDLNKALYAAKHLEVGGVMINEVPTFRVDHMPYGGIKGRASAAKESSTPSGR